MSQDEMLQIIAPDGSFDESLEPDLSPIELRTLYKTMVNTRIFDTRMTALQRQGRLAFYAPCIGEEAAHIGSAYALRPEDWIFPQYREQGALLVRSMPLEQLVCSLIGNRNDISKGRGFANSWGDKSLRIVHSSPPVGTQIPIGVGAALAAKIKGEKVVSLVYFGEGATSSGYFHVGMNFAAVFKTPVVFFCKNNQYAISVPARRQFAAKNIAIKGAGYGMTGVLVDGNDVLAVHRATKEAVEKSRQGGGPTLIEAYTYRMGPHSTPDDPTRYRGEDEVRDWRKKDPITRFRLYLEKKNLWDEKQEREQISSSEAMVTEAIHKADAVGPPDLASMFDDVYSEMPKSLREQMEDASNNQRIS